jgi:hypothetical protein
MPMMLIVFGAYFLLRNWNGDVIPLVAVGGVALAGVLGYRVYRSRTERQRAEKVERANVAALTEQVEGMLADTANRILEVEGRAGLVTSSEASDYFQRAVSTFVSVDERLESAGSVFQLQRLVSDLDDALWRLASARAILDGNEIPPRPSATHAVPSTPSKSATMTMLSRDAVSRWVDGGSSRGHGRRRRSC